jgi:hypothetical protein
MYGLSAAKSAIGSIQTFPTNHAVASNMSRMPVGTWRGNWRAAAVNPAGLSNA